jgi:transcriptional regulator with XRE-family HTH domain
MPRPIYRGFRGDFLREQREQRGWTQEQLAVRVRAFPTMVGKWERDQVKPGASSVAKLARVLEVAPQDFSAEDPATLSLVELRVRAALTRAQAARAAGITERRLRQYEHSSCRPGEDVARLAELYGVAAELVLASYDRERAAAFPGLPTEDQAC